MSERIGSILKHLSPGAGLSAMYVRQLSPGDVSVGEDTMLTCMPAD